MKALTRSKAELLVQDDVIDNLDGLARSPPVGRMPRADGGSTPPEQRAGDPAIQRFRMLSVPALKALPEPSWLIRDFLPQGAFACVYGAPGSGKSFLALDLCLHVATGREWNGHAVEQGLVVYAAGEGVHGLRKRIEAWTRDRGVQPPTDRFFVCLAVPDFLGDDGREFLNALKRLPDRPRFVVIDTLAQTMPGGDENGSSDMGRVVHQCERIARETGATVLLIHHSTKGTGSIRGHSSLPGALDTIIAVSRSGKKVTVKIEKQKDAEAAAPTYLVLEQIQLNPDAEGNPRDSCVLRPQSPQAPARKLADAPQKILNALTSPQFAASGASPKALAEATGVSESHVYRCLDELAGQDRIEKTKRGEYVANSHLS